MRLVVVEGIDPAGIARAVATGTYEKGLRYAQQRAVVHMTWDAATNMLQAVVRGTAGHRYTTAVHFTSRNDSDLGYSWGECSCPVGFDCSTPLPWRSPPPARRVPGRGRARP
ncbi:MAG: SWIM zinc finger family protein [Pseudonocardia sp.]